MSAVKDLTKGSPMKLILGFMLPMLLGLLFQQFYNMVDTIVVGQFLGVNALAGVGSTGSVNFLVLGFCMGVCAGFAIPVAQKFGEKDFDGLRKFVGNTIWLGYSKADRRNASSGNGAFSGKRKARCGYFCCRRRTGECRSSGDRRNRSDFPCHCDKFRNSRGNSRFLRGAFRTGKTA